MIGGDLFLRQIDDAVRDVRSRPEWRESYMRYEVRLMEKYAKGKKDGINELRRHYKQLVAALREGDRLDELPNALEDDALYEQLLAEFGIASDSEDAPKA